MVGLDVNCRVFYNASVDANDFNKHVEFVNGGRFRVKEVNGFPCLIHVPWKKKFGHLLDEIYRKTFYERWFHKKYSWGGYLEGEEVLGEEVVEVGKGEIVF